MNTINRHNYEEFFLMYVDNELTNEQRAEVEFFVRHNPDLQKEFEMLQQTKLTPDEEIMFTHKTDLLKIKDSIGIDNYEEFFLLYIDNELNESGKEAVEKFVLQQPQLQDEFSLLKQTILPQEKIIFPNKKLLYGKEERRAIPYWTRIAAAAAFIGVAALVWWIVPHGNGNINNTTVATVQSKKQTVKPAQSEKTAQPVTQSFTDTSKQLAEQAKNKIRNESSVVKAQKKTVKPVGKNTQAENKNIALNNKKDKDGIRAEPEKVTSEKKEEPVENNEPLIANINSESDNPNKDPLEKAKSINAVNSPNLNNLVQPAVYKELNTNEDDNLQSTLYIGNMGLNKNKVRGIMKKVGGLFAGKSKNSPDEKGKVQVAGFELNTN
jgi:cytoskeletal protein RodZ